MYQPAHNRFSVEEPATLLAELARHIPATLITLASDGLRASILPMLYDPHEGELGTLRGHLARLRGPDRASRSAPRFLPRCPANARLDHRRDGG